MFIDSHVYLVVVLKKKYSEKSLLPDRQEVSKLREKSKLEKYWKFSKVPG